jgi:protocatechuate 3,4-dioxygenase beta subunit
MRDVLIHELAHLARGDCYWNLLRRAATALLFFQPLMWRLSRRLDSTAEEVCDDYVVQFGGDRREYAHRLVDIAELSLAQTAVAGVGIVSLRSMLAARVARIMDTSRSLSTRIGSLLLAIVLTAGLTATLLVGLVGVEPGQVVAEATLAESTSDEGVPVDEPTEVADDEESGAVHGDVITVRGRVVDPDGAPVPDADVYALRWFWDFGDRKPLAQVKADATGRFEISYRKSQFFDAGRLEQWREADIVAFADGFGPGWVTYRGLSPNEEPTIRLVVDDVPIEGRIMDLEGNPVAGATIEMNYLNASKTEDLTEWLNAVRAGQSISTAFEHLGEMVPMFSAGRWQGITTDADGRFRMTGIGRERQVKIDVKHPTIVTQTLPVLTRVTEPIEQLAYDSPRSHKEINYGARFEHAAAPSRPIEGVVRDAKTGGPIAGAEIWSHRFAGENIVGMTTIKTKSDREGRYRLEGMPKGSGNEILVVPVGLPFFTAKFELPDPPGTQPAELNLDLHRGVWVSGRVTDKESGRGVSARMYYIVSPDNQLAAQLPEFENATHIINVQDRYHTKLDGSYRVVALPGHGIIGVNALSEPYPTGQGFEDIPDLANRAGYSKYNSALAPSKKSPTAVKEIRVPENGQDVVCDFELDSGRRIAMRVVDPSGAPLAGVGVQGSRGLHDNLQTILEAEFDIVALNDDEARTVLLHHETRALGKALRMKPADGDAGPVTVRLEPCATVTGRLVDGDGEPIAGAELRIDIAGEGDFGRNLSGTTTDADGRFRHDAFLPGLAYTIFAEGSQLKFTRVAKNLEVHAGETIDLGTIDVTSDQRPEPRRVQSTASHSEARSGSTTDAPALTTVRGRVLGPDGQPVADATVLAAWVFVRGYAPLERFPIHTVAQTKSDAAGNFELTFVGEDADMKRRHYGWQIVAYAPGTGPAWIRDEDAVKESSLTMRLAPDESIRGRIVDLEGKPLAGVRVRVHELFPTVTEEHILEWIADAKQKSPPGELAQYWQASMSGSESQYPDRFPTPILSRLSDGSPALPANTQTDADGRFVLDNLGVNRLAVIEVSGPAIAKTYLQVVTRDIEPISARPLGWLGIRSGTYYGREFEYVADPTQPIDGTVTDLDTGEPLVDVEVRLSRFAGGGGRQENFLTTRTDARGRYRLIGVPPGGGHRIEVMPDIDVPYFPTEKTLGPSDGDLDAITCDFSLKQGNWIVGKVLDGDSGEPIVNATVNYMPLRSNERARDYPNFRPQISGTVPKERIRTADDGSFRVLAIPGAGILAAIANGTERLSYSTVGLEGVPKHLVGEGGFLKAYEAWTTTGYHALREVEIDESADEIAYDLKFTRGLTRLIKIVDANGQPVQGARVLGRTLASFMEEPASDSVVEVIGLRPNQESPVAVLHSERRIGKGLIVSPGNELTIELEPCAIARGRFVDKDGEPVRDVEVVADIDHDDHLARRLIGRTDSDGRFEVLLPPGLTYHVAHYARDGRFSAECEATPGAVFELGDLAYGTKLTTKQTAKLVKASIASDRTSATEPAPSSVTEEASASTTPKSSAGQKLDLGAIDIADESSTKASAAPPSSTANKDLQYAGQVLDAKGQPVAGAKLYLVYWYSNQERPPEAQPLATTTADGRFQFALSRGDFRQTGDSVPPWLWGSIGAAADGHGVAWASSLAFETSGSALAEAKERARLQGRSIEEVQSRVDAERGPLRLARDDIPIEGRVVDTNGQPIAGATVKAVDLRTGTDNTLDAFEKASRRQGIDLYEASQAAPRYLYGPFVAEILPQTQSDDDGQFTLRGLGRDRLVRLVIEADGFETNEVYARLRAAETITLADPLAGTVQIYGAKITHVAAPSRPVEGVVRDAKTQSPVAGVLVTSRRTGVATVDRQIQRAGSDFVRAVTNEAGRFRLAGLPNSPHNQLTFQPGSDQPYLTTTMRVGTRGADSSPVTLDVDLTPAGGFVVGRVVDEGTGEGVSGQIKYLAVNKDGTLPNSAPAARVVGDIRSDMDGHFRFVAPAGPGYLAFTAFDEGYRKMAAAPPGATEMAEYALFMVRDNGPQYHALEKINLDGRRNEYAVELKVARGEIITGQLLDPQGQPLSSSRGSYTGRVELARWQPLPNGKFHVLNFDAARPRQLAFVDPDRQLAGELLLKEKPQAPFTVQLRPWATVSGRIVDEDGVGIQDLTLASGTLKATILPQPGEQATLPQPRLPPAADGWSQIKTDSEGRFVIAGLLPGVEYDLSVHRHTNAFDNLSGDIAQGLTLAPGETRDLGTIELKPVKLEELLQQRQNAIKRQPNAPPGRQANSEPSR